MSPSENHAGDERRGFDRLLGELRPRLHRFCARMTGSVIDGEDVVQEALLKALEAFAGAGAIANPEGWLFRIAHNAALDFLRRRARFKAAHSDEDLAMIVDPATPIDDRDAAAVGLRTFMRLPVTQRGTVILKDVLGHSLAEIGDVMAITIPAVKAALHRGRARLKEIADEPDQLPPPMLAEPERARLAAYVERFNARDFEGVQQMLADEVRLELVNKLRMSGRKEVSTYFGNYAQVSDWLFAPGFVDRRPAALVYDPRTSDADPSYFVLLDWRGGGVIAIRDFRFARYVVEGAELVRVTATAPGS